MQFVVKAKLGIKQIQVHVSFIYEYSWGIVQFWDTPIITEKADVKCQIKLWQQCRLKQKTMTDLIKYGKTEILLIQLY